jgi:uncharacterized protein
MQAAHDLPSATAASGFDAMPAQALQSLLRRNRHIAAILDQVDAICLPDWHLCAGCVAQTVWNIAFDRPPEAGIKDIDIVYFDPTDMTAEGETAHEARLHRHFAGLPALDVKNQARVHTWYARVFGYEIAPYTSVADAIASFPTTATAVGVHIVDGRFDICAPFALDDLLGLIVRPNKRQITRAIYDAKVARWRVIWPDLRIVAWDEA